MICVDELGPLSARTYPGEEWKTGLNRATFEPDYGRRGTLWVLGAFEPATGQATFLLSPRRDSASYIQLLGKVVTAFPAERWLLITDNLSTHHSRETTLALAAWPEIRTQFIPKYACWLNLIEPWWKQLRSLALKGRRFADTDELSDALNGALTYWNDHRHPYRWKKLPQEQSVQLGGFGVTHDHNISSN
ncbi:MAG: IS630 family transposase [Anaerolineae bacterium]|nr:IS630 family transposase [Anaerolineae bacterium]